MNDKFEKYIGKGKSIKVINNIALFEVSLDEVVLMCTNLYKEHHLPLKIITAIDDSKESGFFKIMYVFGVPKENIFLVPYISTKDSFPSLTPTIHEASTYERKIMTFFGLEPTGHPDARSLILHENWPSKEYPLRKDFDWKKRPAMAHGEFQFRKIEGEGIYEIPVGPVHAGIIEPGHFRFSVAGEEILMLEPRLGYSHKGSEKLFEILSLDDKIKLSERISGDSSFSHSLAFCQASEELAELKISERDECLRVVFAELERLANHFGDIGAIMTDTGFNFGGAQGARLREMIMQINEKLTGSRFLRGVNIIGGVTRDIDENTARELEKKLVGIKKDFSEVIGVAQSSASLLVRLKDTGVLDSDIAKDHGVVGVAGRAVGFEIDSRVDFSYAAYDKVKINIALEKEGDVQARFNVRIKEVFTSFDIIRTILQRLPAHPLAEKEAHNLLKKNSCAISIVEGWRGDIVYFVFTDSSGTISRVDVRDPSFLNWTVLGYAGKGNMVPDFPLINKSFNLSYTGFDL